MIATMDLAPVTTSKLEGRTRAWGKELNVVDGAGLRVIEVRLGTAVKPPYAVFRTTNREWRVDRTDPFLPPGRKRSGLRGRAERLDVIDASGDIVATMSSGRLTLSEGEELIWVYPGLTTLCGLGDGLWVARAHWPRRRGFRAEVSGAMLARDDRGLLTGIGAMLTQTSLRSRRIDSWTWGGAGF
jgi:hypothetical protein